MNNRDRRPVLYAAVGAVILVLAFFLFRPGGDSNDLPDTMVLRPQGIEDGELQASIDDGASLESAAEATPATTDEQPETVAEDPFPVKDAKLESSQLSTPIKQTPKMAAPVKVEGSAQSPGLGGDYYLVVGSYGDPTNAQRLVRQLDAAGVAAEIHSAEGSNGPLHRVRVGYFPDHSRAEAFGRKLKKDMQLDFWIASR